MSFALVLLASSALKRFTVYALCLCGVRFVCSHLDCVKCAVVCVFAVILTLCYCAFDALVCVFVIHSLLLKYCFFLCNRYCTLQYLQKALLYSHLRLFSNIYVFIGNKGGATGIFCSFFLFIICTDNYCLCFFALF